MAVGFLLLSVATSLPELAVSLTSALGNQTSISVGNVLGANIADVALVLGLSALVGRVYVKKQDVPDIVLLLALVSLLPLFLLTGFLSAFYGLLLLAVFVAYAYKTLQTRDAVSRHEPATARQAVFAAFSFCASIALITVSAQYAVGSAVLLAEGLGISKSLVAATIVSLGTTLPELAVNLQAMRMRRPSLAVGNIVGSAVVNLTLVLGLAALINPLVLRLDAVLYLVASALAVNGMLLYFVYRHRGIRRQDGAFLLFAYALFLFISVGMEVRLFLIG
jgi:cation:H+ antiporter